MTEGHLVFFITDGEAEQLRNLRIRNPSDQIYLRATLESIGSKFTTETQVDLVFSSILDLMPDVYYQMGKVLTEMETNANISS